MIVRVLLEVVGPDGRTAILRASREDATIDRESDFEGNMARSASTLTSLMDDAANSMDEQIVELRAAAQAEMSEPPPRPGRASWPERRGHGAPRRRP